MNAFDDRLRELRARFVARSRLDREALKAAMAVDDRAEVQRIAHSLAGNGGLFGFPEISRAGQELEEALEDGAEENRVEEACDILLKRLGAIDQPD